MNPLFVVATAYVLWKLLNESNEAAAAETPPVEDNRPTKRGPLDPEDFEDFADDLAERVAVRVRKDEPAPVDGGSSPEDDMMEEDAE